MNDWVTLARRCIERGERCALISVTGTQGSTPREVGARMLLTPSARYGTVGGGKLEYDACARARDLMDHEGVDLGLREVYRLGPRLGQCCGGTVELCIQSLGRDALPFLHELEQAQRDREPHISVVMLRSPDHAEPAAVHRMVVRGHSCTGAREDDPSHARLVAEARGMLRATQPAPRWSSALPGDVRALLEPPPDPGLCLLLFGAGHVGRALVQVLAPLEWHIQWVETRDEMIPRSLPANVTQQVTDTPEACVVDAPAGAAFVIMTHDHGLDFRLCEHVLRRQDAIFSGLIGSRSKRARFVRRLRGRGTASETLERLTCPIGLPGLGGKAPGEIAISVAAQLMQVHARSRALLDHSPLAVVRTRPATV